MDFEEYVAARGPALLRLAFVLTGDTHLAQDLVQAGLARAYGRWGRVSRAQHPDAYVRRIIVNEHLGWRRRRLFGEQPRAGGDVAADTTDAADPVFGPAAGWAVSADPSQGVVDRDEAAKALGLLPARARTVLVLRYYADLDDAAIAELMGISTSTVRSTASRALAALRVAHRPAMPSPTGDH